MPPALPPVRMAPAGLRMPHPLRGAGLSCDNHAALQRRVLAALDAMA